MTMPAGQPTKYKEEYSEEIVKYFKKNPPFEIVKHIEGKGKKERVWEEKVVHDLPLLQDFAHEIGVCKDTILAWAEEHEEFSGALKKAKAIQEKFFVVNGLRNNWNTTFAIFAAKNVIGWRDVKELTGKDGGPLTIAHVIDKLESHEQKLIKKGMENGAVLQDQEQGQQIGTVPTEQSAEGVQSSEAQS